MTVKLKRALGCFSSGWNPVFFNYMAHSRHSNTQNCERKSIRGHSYWLNLPCLLASCPISCQNSKKLSSPSLFLSNELISWSMAAGSSAFCRKTGNHMYPILKKNRLSPWIMQKIRLTLVMCMEREIRGKQNTLACKRVKKKIMLHQQKWFGTELYWLCPHLVVIAIITTIQTRRSMWNFPHCG